jgi:hypothetical protein
VAAIERDVHIGDIESSGSLTIEGDGPVEPDRPADDLGVVDQSAAPIDQDGDPMNPQGSPISPLLTNICMRRFVKGWKAGGHEWRLKARIINYADDFVICCRGTADDAMAVMLGMMSKLKLTVNETKTRLCRLPEESFDFLGYTIGRCYSQRTGEVYVGPHPSQKSIQRFCREISEMTVRGRSVDYRLWLSQAGTLPVQASPHRPGQDTPGLLKEPLREPLVAFLRRDRHPERNEPDAAPDPLIHPPDLRLGLAATNSLRTGVNS